MEVLDRIVPGMDREMARALQKVLERQGLTFSLATAARKAAVEDGRVAVTIETGGTATTESFDRVLVAVGRRPYTADLGLEGAGVALDARGRITVDHRFETSVPGVHAIGDVIAGPMLAHKAEDEGIACVELHRRPRRPRELRRDPERRLHLAGAGRRRQDGRGVP